MEYASNESFILTSNELRFAIAAAGLETLWCLNSGDSKDSDENVWNRVLVSLYQKRYVEWQGEKDIHMLPPFSDLVACLKNLDGCLECEMLGDEQRWSPYYLAGDNIVRLDSVDDDCNTLKMTFLKEESFLSAVLDSLPEDILETDPVIDGESFTMSSDSSRGYCLAVLQWKNPYTGRMFRKAEIVLNGIICTLEENEQSARFTEEGLKKMLIAWRGKKNDYC